MENKDSKEMMKYVNYAIGAIVIILIVVLVVLKVRSSKEAALNEVAPVVVDTTKATEDTSKGSVNSGSKAKPMSYADALIKYADKRIQLDKDCQAFPNNVTYKDNTGIMIDNRAPVARTVKIGTEYSVKAYGFKIIVLPDTYLKSKTILVDCDKSQNVATILVQE